MKYVSINGKTLAKNSRTGSRDPVIRIAKSPSDSKPVYANSVHILGPAKLMYQPDKPIMKCGARLVIECADAIVPIGER